jgi:hypothetical protein
MYLPGEVASAEPAPATRASGQEVVFISLRESQSPKESNTIIE